MAINLSSLAPITSGANTLSSLILITPVIQAGIQPQNGFVKPGQAPLPNQPEAILFHYEGEQSVLLESDITDHYAEDNTAIQDHIARKPIVITTHGFVGELNDIPPVALQYLKVLADKLTVINAYTPALSVTALLAYNDAVLAAATALQLFNSVATTVGTFFGGHKTKQQEYFSKFYKYWQDGALFTVQTPWNIFNNMAIKSLRAIQDQETNVISDFEVTFKQMNFTDLAVVGGFQTMQGRANNQSQGLVDLGQSTPSVPGPSMSSLFNGIGGAIN